MCGQKDVSVDRQGERTWTKSQGISIIKIRRKRGIGKEPEEAQSEP